MKTVNEIISSLIVIDDVKNLLYNLFASRGYGDKKIETEVNYMFVFHDTLFEIISIPEEAYCIKISNEDGRDYIVLTNKNKCFREYELMGKLLHLLYCKYSCATCIHRLKNRCLVTKKTLVNYLDYGVPNCTATDIQIYNYEKRRKLC